MDRSAAFLLRLYRAARETEPHEFQVAALDMLRAQVSFDSALWASGHVLNNGGLIPLAVLGHELDPESIAEWAQLNRADKSIPMVIRRLGEAVPIHAPTLFSDPDDAVLRDYTRRHGRQLFLATGLNAAPGKSYLSANDTLRWVTLYRRDGDALFPDQDQSWIQSTVPHLLQALDISRQLHTGAPGSALLEAPAHTCSAVAEPDGRLLNAMPGFSALLAKEWAQFDGQRLPSTVMTSVREDGVYRGRRIRMSLQHGGGMVLIQAWAISMQSSAVNKLSSRQQEVAEFYVLGFSHKEIARKIEISPTTVRNHLSAIYAITGAHSRRELEVALSRA